MLRILRKKNVTKRVLWVLAALIIPAFVLWGAGGGTRGKNTLPSHIGTIGGRRVSFKNFAKSYDACYQQLMLSSGGDPKIFKELSESVNIPMMAWQRLIMLEEAKKQNIAASDEEVANAIASHPVFKRGGVFDKELYGYILRNNLRTAPREFEERIREDITISKLRNGLLKDIYAGDNELLNEYKTQNEKISISYVLIEPQNYEKGFSVTEEELKDYYSVNRKAFRRGDEVNISYFHMDAENADLLYEVSRAVNDAEAFVDISEKNGLKIEETGFFGRDDEIPGIGVSYELVKAAFSLEPGMTSFPIHTQKGYYVINVKEKRKGHLPGFEEIKPLLGKELIRLKSSDYAEDVARGAYSQISGYMAQGLDFKQAAEKLNLKTAETGPFSRREYIEGIGRADALKRLAFDLPEAEISPPTRCEKGFVVFQVSEIIPAEEAGFEKEKGDLRERVLADKRAEALEAWFDGVSQNAELKIDLDLLSAQ